jgi:hypothetical protein
MVRCVFTQGTNFFDLRAAKLLKVIKFVVDGARLRVLQVERVQEGQRNFVDSQEARNAAVAVGCGLILFYTI